MKICILHRYLLSLVVGTNPSFPIFVNKLISKGHVINFISFKETENNISLNGLMRREINLSLNSVNGGVKIPHLAVTDNPIQIVTKPVYNTSPKLSLQIS